MNATWFSVGKSLLLHVAIGVMLLMSVDYTRIEKNQDIDFDKPIIQAVMIGSKVLEQQAKRLQDEKDEQRRKEEQQVANLEKQKKQKLEEKQKAEQAAAKLKSDKAKAKKLEEDRKQQEKAKIEEQARKDKEKKAKEEKAQKDAERKRQDAKEKAEQERLINEQLKAEQAVRQQRRNKQVLSEVQKYTALIKQTIQRNLIVDDSMKGRSCRLNIRLASNGLVIDVKIIEGDTILCRTAKNAVYKSDTLPVSPEADVYEKLRDINLTVEPEL
jgi:colicin import membrane protein